MKSSPSGRAVEAGPLPSVPAQQRPEPAGLPPAGRAAAEEQGGRAGAGGRRGWDAILQHRVRFNIVFIVIGSNQFNGVGGWRRS